MKNYWLLKSEPDAFSLQDLKDKGVAPWDGVRNYQARNFLSAMKKGDLAFFYHSRIDPPAIVGVCKVVKEGAPDQLARDPKSKYYDPKASDENPRWVQVEVEFVEEFKNAVPLPQLKETRGLEEMRVTQKGSRLSVQPVTAKEWKIIVGLGRK